MAFFLSCLPFFFHLILFSLAFFMDDLWEMLFFHVHTPAAMVPSY